MKFVYLEENDYEKNWKDSEKLQRDRGKMDKTLFDGCSMEPLLLRLAHQSTITHDHAAISYAADS